MRTFILLLSLLLFAVACEDTGRQDDHQSDTDTDLQPAEDQQLSYNNLLQKLTGSTSMQDSERFRFLMVDNKRELLHFFSIQKKDQEYMLGAEFQTCIQVGGNRQNIYDKSCRDLYKDEYSRIDQLLRSILENPRHDQTDVGQQEFYFQHFSMTDAVIYGTDQDIFALELYLAMLRFTEADESLIQEYEAKKNALVGM